MAKSKTPTVPAASIPSTDNEIRERAARLLARNPYRALQIVDCECQDGALILKGHVGTFHLKQLAQAAVAELCALARIDNRIVVQETPPLVS